MSIHQRISQHEEAGTDDSSTCCSSDSSTAHSVASDTPSSREGTPTRLQRENEALRKQLQEQQDKLRLLEEQVRLASMEDIPSRSSSGRRHRSFPASRRRKGCGVDFCEDVFCYANPRSFNQIVESWYSKDELAIFKGERKMLIKELKRVNFDLDQIDRNKYHLRGLEPYLSIKYNKYMQKKRAAVLQTVIFVQNRQKKEGKVDPESLRVACCEASAWARERAADLGRRDAKAVGYEPSAGEKKSQPISWGNESDVSRTPSLCSTVASSSTDSSRSFGNESFDSLRLQSPSMRRHTVTLEKVDELPSL